MQNDDGIAARRLSQTLKTVHFKYDIVCTGGMVNWLFAMN